jgi:Acyl-CoA thioesterase C-terminal domain/Acyl-CoA thioesterase N-terminal domain
LSHPEPSPAPSPEPAAIFRREGEELVPSLFAQGPWNPEHLHGGPICGVLAHAIETCPSPVPMRVARMTVEMTRPVPLAPFSVHAEVTRAGRRIQQIDARIAAAGQTLVRASALRVRIGRRDEAIAIPFHDPLPARVPGPPRDPEMLRLFSPGFIRALDFMRSQLAAPGEPGVTWSRMRVPLVEGELVTPFVRLATVCDFASGTGNPIDFARFTSINPDLSLHVLREPRSEWIGIRARSGIDADGIGQSYGTLFDAEGPVARALVSLLVERRDPR